MDVNKKKKISNERLQEVNIMPYIVPSQVVSVIDKLFPRLNDQNNAPGNEVTIDYTHLYSVCSVASLVDQIPQELLTIQADDYAEYTASVAAIKTSIETWTSLGNIKTGNLSSIHGLSHLNPITIIRRALEKCADEFPSSSTSEMSFIKDDDFRDSIRIDISNAHRAYINNEWKAATVLSGSAIEALLLWAIQKKSEEEIDAIRKELISNKIIKKDTESNSEKWDLFTLLEIAHKAEIICKETYIGSKLAKDFRNLIHPGKSIRLGQKCNKATALSSIAALEHVINDLS